MRLTLRLHPIKTPGNLRATEDDVEAAAAENHAGGVVL